ncbi:hypothetical protein OG21DRAFT_1514252, partial [Imleria badia]
PIINIFLVSHHYKIIAAGSGKFTAKRYTGPTKRAGAYRKWDIQVQGTAATDINHPLATYSAACNEDDNDVGKQADTEWKIVDNGNGTKSICILNYAWTVDANKVILYLHDSADSRQRFTLEQI